MQKKTRPRKAKRKQSSRSLVAVSHRQRTLRDTSQSPNWFKLVRARTSRLIMDRTMIASQGCVTDEIVISVRHNHDKRLQHL